MFRVSDKLQLIGSSFLVQAIRIAATFVMARLISPKDNGAYFLVLYVGGLVGSLGDFCVPQSLVQIKEFPEQTLIDSAILFQGLLFAGYGLFTIAGGLVLTHVQHDSRLWKLAIIVSVTNLLSSLYYVQLAALNRRLQFRAESRQNLIFSFAAAGAGIGTALLGWGVYAIALQTLVGQAIANIAVQRVARLKWPHEASWPATKRFLKLGIPMSAASYVVNIEGSIVGLAINSIAGEVGVGLWGKVIQVQQLFAQNLMASFQRVAYPLLCHSTSDLPRMRKLFARVIVTLMIVSLLFTGILAANSRDIIRICLGPMWTDAAPLLRVAAWAVPAGTLMMVGYMLNMALGQTKSIFRGMVINLCAFVPLVLLARPWGLVALAVCWSASRYLVALVVLVPAAHSIQTGLRAVSRELRGLIISAGAATAAMFAVVWAMHRSPLLPRLILSGCVGLAIYAGMIWLLQRDALTYALRMARGGSSIPSDPAANTMDEERALVDASSAAPADSQAFVLSATGGQADGIIPPPRPEIGVDPENGKNKAT